MGMADMNGELAAEGAAEPIRLFEPPWFIPIPCPALAPIPTPTPMPTPMAEPGLLE